MSEIKLKPCPFCGSGNIDIKTYYCGLEDSDIFVICQDCGAMSPHIAIDIKDAVEIAKTAAIEAWNERAYEE